MRTRHSIATKYFGVWLILSAGYFYLSGRAYHLFYPEHQSTDSFLRFLGFGLLAILLATIILCIYSIRKLKNK